MFPRGSFPPPRQGYIIAILGVPVLPLGITQALPRLLPLGLSLLRIPLRFVFAWAASLLLAARLIPRLHSGGGFALVLGDLALILAAWGSASFFGLSWKLFFGGLPFALRPAAGPLLGFSGWLVA